MKKFNYLQITDLDNSLFPVDLSEYRKVVTRDGERFLAEEEYTKAVNACAVVEASDGNAYEKAEMERRISFDQFRCISGEYFTDVDYHAAKEAGQIVECAIGNEEILASMAKTDPFGRPVCPEHFEKTYFVCPDCGKIVRRTRNTIEYKGKLICNDCRNHNYYRCDRCHKWHRKSESSGRVAIAPDVFETWCPDCIAEEAAVCPNCRSFYSKKYCTESFVAKLHENGTCGRCPDCFTDLPFVNIGYREKPSGLYFDRDSVEGEQLNGNSDKIKNTIYYGVELEMDTKKLENGEWRDSAPDHVGRFLTMQRNDVYCKMDGSLRRGIEIITRPCSAERHTDTEMWNEICSTGLAFGLNGHDVETAGLHIHISRRPFVANHVDDYCVKFLNAFDNDRFWGDWCKLARRRSCTWAKRYSATAHGRNLVFDIIRSGFIDNHNDRYYCVNYTNDNTVEIRIFKSSLNPATVKATIWCVTNLAQRILDGFDPASAMSFKRLFELEKAPQYVLDYFKERRI